VFTSGKYDVRSMMIFNRWGQKVFDGTGDERWDGTHNNKPAVIDVYPYIIQLERPSGELIILKGDVTLVR
jgi:gliding motility-associated-like protein